MEITDVIQYGNAMWWMEGQTLQKHIATRQVVDKRLQQQSPSEIFSSDRNAAIIEVRGVMTRNAEWIDEVSTIAIQEAVNQAAADDSIGDILLLIDSPGGEASGMPQLAESLANAKAAGKRIIAQSDGIIASAAYYFAVGADEVYVQQGDLVGSIGTRMQLYDFSEMFEKLGVKAINIDTGSLKSAGAMGLPITEEQQEYFQGIVEGYQAGFTEIVMRCRGYSQASYDVVATGGVFHASDALKLGLIDGVRSVNEALAGLQPMGAAAATQESDMSDKPDAAPQKSFEELAQERKEAIVSACPGAGEDFINAQLASGADAAKAGLAWTEKLAAENEELKKKAEQAEKKAAAKPAEKKERTVRGNLIGGNVSAGSEEEEETDWFAMAKEYQREHNVRWSEACLEIKRQYPESRAAFGAPPLVNAD